MRNLLLVVLALSGCVYPNAPREGAKCLARWTAECVSANVIAYCEEEKWVAYGCPSECRDLQAPRCDWVNAREGEQCPKSLEGQGFCTAAGTAFMCLTGRWSAATCTECTQDSASSPLLTARPSCR